MNITSKDAQKIRELLNSFDWYAADRYTSAGAVVLTLRRRGYNDAEVQAIMQSKWMRWAANSRTDDRATSGDLERWLDDPKNKATDTAVSELVRETFDCVAKGDECPSCREARIDSLVWKDDCDVVTCSTCGHTYTPGKTVTKK